MNVSSARGPPGILESNVDEPAGELSDVGGSVRPANCRKGEIVLCLSWTVKDFPGPLMKAPRRYFDPLAIGAPRPLLELPSRLERMIHFIPPHNEKVRAKAAELVGQVDVVLGNLEDAIPIDAKEAARDGLIAMAKATDFGSTDFGRASTRSIRPGSSTI